MIYRKKVFFRLDDYAHNLNFKNWERVLTIFNDFDISVCIGVIPFNKDPSLLNYKREFDDFSFWRSVSELSNAGHVIAIHGCHHLYHKVCFRENFIPINESSEFTGLSYDVQKSLLQKSICQFATHNLNLDLFMAPSHSFDNVTLQVLSDSGVRYITDGSYFRPVLINDIRFLPQLFGNLISPIFPFQTICLHPNTMTGIDIDRLYLYLEKYRSSISDFSTYRDLSYKQVGILDRIFSLCFNIRYLIKRL